MRVVQLVEHALEETDEFFPGRDPPQVGGVQTGNVGPRSRLRVEVRVRLGDPLAEELEILLEVVSRGSVGRREKRGRDGETAHESGREAVPRSRLIPGAGAAS